MKRTLFLILAVLTAVFGVLVALDVVNFETDRIDRWVMIFSFAGVAFLVGLASADAAGGDTEPTSTRALAAQKLDQTRPDPADLPSKPGSLHRRQPIEAADASLVETDASLVEVVAMEHEQLDIDPIEAELHGMIDEEQIDEITALTDNTVIEDELDEHSTDVDTSSSPVTSDVDLPVEQAAITLDDGESVPLARLELRLADYDDAALERVVKESETVVINEMIRTGQLTSEGELTEKDIASMVFLAYTSEEMLAELRLRKALDQPGDVAVTGRDFAPLKNIE